MTSKKLHLPTITAVLKQWRLSKTIVSGDISESRSPVHFPNGKHVLIDVQSVTHYNPIVFPKMDEPEHWLILSTDGKYFKIFIGDKWKNLGA